MFTGLIESIGRVVSSRPLGGGLRLAIESEQALESLRLGESVAVDGVCLTVTTFAGDRRFEVDVSGESMERSTLGELV
ncbi:MAG: riboflavin synthase, partial [Myxococcota bacterium]|nr:riboflavin synthase [Myxococcota bacterium]